MSPDGACRLRQKLVCPETGKEYSFGDTAMGYEIAPGEYVLFDREELKRLKPESGRTIHIDSFVDVAEIDPIYYERAYYLLPDKNGAEHYKLLLESMRTSGRAAVGKMVMRDKQYVIAIRVRGNALLLQTLTYADEVLGAEEAGVPKAQPQITKAERDMAEHLIKAMSQPLDLSQFHDEYTESVKKVIDQKAAGEAVDLPAAEAPPPTYNLTEALKKSLEQMGKAEQPAKKKGSRRKKSA